MKNPMLIDFPSILQTKRLTLRAHRPGDGKMINAAVKETYSQLKQWMPWAKTMPPVWMSELFACNAQAEFIKRESLQYGIHPKDQITKLVGCIGIINCDWRAMTFEMGYWCRKSSQGNGYISESADWLTHILANHFKARRVVIRCDARNTASAKVAQGLDFRLEGVHRNLKLDNRGRHFNMMVFAKTF